MTTAKIKEIATSVGKTMLTIGVAVLKAHGEESQRKQKEDKRYQRHRDTRRRNIKK